VFRGSLLSGRKLRLALRSGWLALVACASLSFAAPAGATALHYCYTSASPNLGGQAGCEVTDWEQVTYNQVDASADAVCETLSDYVPAPSPISGIFVYPETCIGTGGTSVSSYYNGSWHHPWIGNRHSYAVTIYSGTHFDIPT